MSAPTTLDDLCAVLNALRNVDDRDDLSGLYAFAAQHGLPTNGGIDFTSLPTFGGPEPVDTSGIYSWDATRLLVQGNESLEWKLIDRVGGGK